MSCRISPKTFESTYRNHPIRLPAYRWHESIMVLFLHLLQTIYAHPDSPACPACPTHIISASSRDRALAAASRSSETSSPQSRWPAGGFVWEMFRRMAFTTSPEIVSNAPGPSLASRSQRSFFRRCSLNCLYDTRNSQFCGRTMLIFPPAGRRRGSVQETLLRFRSSPGSGAPG